jgi:hypothetical protein
MITDLRNSSLWRWPDATACIKDIGIIHKPEDPSILADVLEVIDQCPLVGIDIASCRWSGRRFKPLGFELRRPSPIDPSELRDFQQCQGDGPTTALIKNIGTGIAVRFKAKLNPEKRSLSNGSQAADIVLVSRNGRGRDDQEQQEGQASLHRWFHGGWTMHQPRSTGLETCWWAIFHAPPHLSRQNVMRTVSPNRSPSGSVPPHCSKPKA